MKFFLLLFLLLNTTCNSNSSEVMQVSNLPIQLVTLATTLVPMNNINFESLDVQKSKDDYVVETFSYRYLSRNDNKIMFSYESYTDGNLISDETETEPFIMNNKKSLYNEGKFEIRTFNFLNKNDVMDYENLESIELNLWPNTTPDDKYFISFGLIFDNIASYAMYESDKAKEEVYIKYVDSNIKFINDKDYILYACSTDEKLKNIKNLNEFDDKAFFNSFDNLNIIKIKITSQ